jgi:hypothetical protein
LSIKGQLRPTLDWLQAQIGFSNEELEKLVQMQPAVLRLRAEEQLEPNVSWLQDRLALDQESLQTAVPGLTPMVGGLVQLLGLKMKSRTLSQILFGFKRDCFLMMLVLQNWSGCTHRVLA